MAEIREITSEIRGIRANHPQRFARYLRHLFAYKRAGDHLRKTYVEFNTL